LRGQYVINVLHFYLSFISLHFSLPRTLSPLVLNWKLFHILVLGGASGGGMYATDLFAVYSGSGRPCHEGLHQAAEHLLSQNTRGKLLSLYEKDVCLLNYVLLRTSHFTLRYLHSSLIVYKFSFLVYLSLCLSTGDSVPVVAESAASDC